MIRPTHPGDRGDDAPSPALSRGGASQSPKRPIIIGLIVIMVSALLWLSSRKSKPVSNVQVAEEEPATGTEGEEENVGEWQQGKVREPHVELKLVFYFTMTDGHFQPQVWEKFFKDGEGRFEIFARSSQPKDVKKQKLFSKNLIPPSGQTETAAIRDALTACKPLTKRRGAEMILFLTDYHVPIQSFDEVYDLLMTTPRHSRALFQTWTNLTSEHQNRYALLTNRDSASGGIGKENFHWHPLAIALNKKHVGMLTENDMTKLWENVPATHEHYWLTTLSHLGVDFGKEFDPKCISFTDGSEPKLFPKKLTPQDIANFATSECPLASQFGKDSYLNSHWKFIMEAREAEDPFGGEVQ